MAMMERSISASAPLGASASPSTTPEPARQSENSQVLYTALIWSAENFTEQPC